MGRSLNSVERFDLAAGSWAAVTPMRTPRTSATAAAVASQIYALGGFDGTTAQRSVERYDIACAEWTTLPPMAWRRVGLASASLAGVVYAFGGRHNEHLLN